MPIWSIVIGILATAVMASLSVKCDSGMHGSIKQKCKKKRSKKQNHERNSKKLSARWKGASEMTIVFATFMVSIGIPGRDSMVCG